ncbi:subtilisin-like serine protease QhpE [Pseudomonas fluorescens]|uniref:subtilisin-like serine protease QhpE n=1 Tax=Pseudomonas fluorescens TaxID=294 RepID=UPI0003706790
MNPRVGIIDSGVSEALFPHVAESNRFDELPGADPAQPDAVGHGDQLARMILRHCNRAELHIAQVFHTTRHAPISRIVSAIDWLVVSGAQLINMSFGIRSPSDELLYACEYAKARGVLLIASAPSTGGVVFPAGWSSCLSVTGDVRCGVEQISWLNQKHAEFGACSMLDPRDPEQGGGASLACARVTGMAAQLMGAENIPLHRLPNFLRSSASYIGAEQRRT